jgi:molecular chaperone GrpE
VGEEKKESKTGLVDEQQVLKETAFVEAISDLYSADGQDDQIEQEKQPDIKVMAEELEAAKDKVLRIAADADNFKKRMEREKERLLKYAGENILRELLATVDNLERALAQGKEESRESGQKLEAMLVGLELTNKGLLGLLEKFVVVPLEVVGCEFDPDKMDALVMENSDDVPKNHVVREFAKGYRFKDKILRHAQVVVSKGQG